MIGQRFELASLRYLMDSPDYLCVNLVAQYLVRAEGEHYFFAQALVRDAVYDSLIETRRRALHRQIAEWFRERDLVLYAEHLDQAGDSAAADAYLAAAQDQAAALRFEQAVKSIERGLELTNNSAMRRRLLTLQGETLGLLISATHLAEW